MRRHLIQVVVLTAVLCAPLPAAQAADMEMEIALRNAVFRGDQQPAEGKVLLLDVRRADDGTWHRVWGVAKDFNIGMHPGRVVDAEITDGAIHLAIKMDIRHDSWTWGAAGRARYELTLTRGRGGKLEGTYTGTLRGIEVSGEATGAVWPERPKVREGEPAEPGEHPRILLRKADLDHYREKMNTPLGKAAMQRMGDGVVELALKYVLTGDEEAADACIPKIEKLMARGAISDQFGHNLGARMEQTAIAYDCCYDAWPESFQRKVEAYLVWGAYKVFYSQGTLGGGINWNVTSNWSAPIYAGVGFAGLALWGEEGPEPPRPIEPNAGAHIPPDDDYTPGEGVPVLDFASDEMPGEWIYIAGVESSDADEALAGIRDINVRLDGYGDILPEDSDPLEAIGGVAAARPEVGTKLEYGGETHTFRPVSHEKDKGYWNMGGKLHLDVTNAAGRELWCRNYFFTVLRNDKPRWVHVPVALGGAAMYVNGVRVDDNDAVYLEAKGLYPVMLDVPVEWMNAWGRHFMRPRFVEVDEQEARRLIALRNEAYQAELEDWQWDRDRWERSGRMDQQFVKLFEAGRQMMYRHYRDAMGTRGWQGELAHYGNIAASAVVPYAPAYRKIFCCDVSPYEDITHYLPAKMMGHLYPDDRLPWAQEINTDPKLSADFFAPLFPVVPARWKPAVLWAWHRHVAGGEGRTDPGPPPEQEAPARLAGGSPIYTFLHYPLETEPAEPATSMPRTWEAPTYGHYVFRSGWSGGDDFVVQAWGKSHYIGGWNSGNAGTFRLAGLGHKWAVGPHDRNRSRFEENVVLLPENPEIIEGACAHPTVVATEADGSGVVSFDMNDVYAARPKEKKRRYASYGHLRNAWGFAESGITGMRSIGVDYSGRCGAPCLLAVVDDIDGGGRKVWTWQLPDADLERTTVEGNTFTIRKPDGATLRGTFVAPRGVEVVAELRKKTMIGHGGSTGGKKLPRPVHGVFATGGDDFFCVITVRRGDPPEVKVTGRGLDAKVTVGGREVRFDGKKILFSDAN
jgi:hypothetical protein